MGIKEVISLYICLPKRFYGHYNGHYLIVDILKVLRVFSSVGLERYLDRVEVGGSNPSTPTSFSSFLNNYKNLIPLSIPSLDFFLPQSNQLYEYYFFLQDLF